MHQPEADKKITPMMIPRRDRVSIFYPTIHTPTNALPSAKYMTMQTGKSIEQRSVLLRKGHATHSLCHFLYRKDKL